MTEISLPEDTYHVSNKANVNCFDKSTRDTKDEEKVAHQQTKKWTD